MRCVQAPKGRTCGVLRVRSQKWGYYTFGVLARPAHGAAADTPRLDAYERFCLAILSAWLIDGRLFGL